MTKAINIRDGVNVFTLVDMLLTKGITQGERFNIKMKVGKRAKFRSFRATWDHGRFCESCGHYSVLTLKKGDKRYDFDTHFGCSFVSTQTLGQ